MLQQSGEKDSEKSPEQKRQTEESQPVNLAHKLPEGLEKALLNLPEAEKERLIVATMREEQFRGPFPHPQHAVEYEKICPGFLARSLAMAEKAQAANIEIARQKLENERLAIANKNLEIEAQIQRDKQDSEDTKRGQYLGFSILAVLIATAVFLAWAEHETTACVLFGVAVFAVIGKVFATKFSRSGKTG